MTLGGAGKTLPNHIGSSGNHQEIPIPLFRCLLWCFPSAREQNVVKVGKGSSWNVTRYYRFECQ